MAIEVVEFDGHRVGVFVVAYGSSDVSASASGPVAGGLRSPVCVRSNTSSASIGKPAMTPRRYGPLAYVPINRRPPLAWPSGARVALWVNPNVEFFGLDDVMPSNLNDRVPRDQAKIPNVRNWALRDYGNRIGIWRLMERY
jgi:hypothetical protein